MTNKGDSALTSVHVVKNSHPVHASQPLLSINCNVSFGFFADLGRFLRHEKPAEVCTTKNQNHISGRYFPTLLQKKPSAASLTTKAGFRRLRNAVRKPAQKLVTAKGLSSSQECVGCRDQREWPSKRRSSTTSIKFQRLTGRKRSGNH